MPHVPAPERQLHIADFAHIRTAEIDFGDLTVLVGPQASGKSIVLQLLKLIHDRGEVVRKLRAAGFDWSNDGEFLERCLGEGWAGAWSDSTTVRLDGREWAVKDLRVYKGQKSDGQVFYIPAHRTLVLDNGWPRLFQQFTPDTPVVVRLFSQALHDVMTKTLNKSDQVLFPHDRRLRSDIKTKLDEAAFHGGKLRLVRRGAVRRLTLTFDAGSQRGASELGFMSWTTGQRELVPLLLGLYHLLPSGRIKKRPDIEWVIIEEPELGLHPRAILAVLLMVLDLLQRGYKVVLATHAPVVLDLVFALKQLRRSRADPLPLLDAMKWKATPGATETLRAALSKEYRVYAFDFGRDGRVRTTDISDLDPGAADDVESGWGGLTTFSGAMLDTVARAVSASAAS